MWEGLFEFVMGQAELLLGRNRVRAFVHDLCHPSRFNQLLLEKPVPTKPV